MAAAATSIGSLLYILGEPEQFSIFFREKYARHLILVRTHGVSASVALLLGPTQFLYPREWAHRWRGYLYLTGVVVGGVTGLLMASMALGGLFSQLGFCLMALLWLFTGVRAYEAARKRMFRKHKAWMIRNFSLAFGAVVLRMYLFIGHHLNFDFDVIYPTSVWVCWTPCLVVGELFVARLARGSKAKQ